MDTSSQVTPPAGRPAWRNSGRDGQSGEGARSVMEQLMQQERKRAAQRQAEPDLAARPAEPPAP